MDEIGKMLGGLGGDGGAAGGAFDGGAGGDLVGALGGLVGGEGGLQGLIAQLGQGGLGDVVGSWVGTGRNRPVDPQQLASALGPEKLQQLAGQSGLSIDKLLPILAAALPTIIDAVTPDGKVTSGDATAGLDIGGLLEGLSGAAKAGADSPLASIGDLLKSKG
ncbi:MAG: YidB family protein [Chloroflexota bacterium]